MTQHILEPGNVVAAGTATTKQDAIREAGALLVAAGAVTSAYVDSMFDREASVSTYMGNFLAIPHGTNEAKESIIRSSLSLVRYPEPIDWDGQPGEEFVEFEGLGQVVVCPGVQARHLVRLVAAGSEHEDGYGLGARLAAPLLGQLHAALARQHPVQQDGIGQHRVQLALGRGAVFRPDRLEAVVAQVDRDQFSDRGLVFDDQDSGHLLH